MLVMVQKLVEPRAYSFQVTDASYSGDETEWDLYLYDIQTHTQLLVNSAVSNTELPTTCFVEGLSSGATGFAVSSGGNSTTITLSDTSGTFIAGEELRFGTGVTRSVRTVTEFSLDDVKSVYQDASALGLQTDFTADVVLKTTVIKELGVGDQVNVNGSSVLTCAGKTFGSLKINDIIIVNLATDAAPRFNRSICHFCRFKHK